MNNGLVIKEMTVIYESDRLVILECSYKLTYENGKEIDNFIQKGYSIKSATATSVGGTFVFLERNKE
jgi:hypothetical protein